MTSTVKYVAQLAHVREVSLLGTADLAYWKDHLRPEDLVPAEVDGRAQILIIAADMKWMGIRFREVSFSVLVDPPGAYLVQAFNSSRMLAWCERTFFSTPYYHGDVRVSAAYPPSVELRLRGEVVFRAAMGEGTPAREPSRV